MKIKIDIDPAAVDADGICKSQTPAAGGAQSLNINGDLTDTVLFDVTAATYSGDSAGIAGRKIAFVFAANETGRTFTITGTDQDGAAQSNTLAGSTGTVEDTLYWQTITSITVDADTAGALTVGTVDEIITKTWMLNYYHDYPATVAVAGLTGTCQFDIDETFDDVLANGASSANWIAAQSNKSADLAASIDRYASAVRLKFDSYTAGAELQFHIMQPPS